MKVSIEKPEVAVAAIAAEPNKEKAKAKTRVPVQIVRHPKGVPSTPPKDKPAKVSTFVPPSNGKVAVKILNPNARPVGRTLKLGVGGTWAHVFQENEGRAKPWKDEQITEFMIKEFPGRKSEIFSTVATVRSKYNKGGFNAGVPPKVQSRPHNKPAEKK